MSEATESASHPATGDYIDAHVHVWTDDFEHYPLAAEFSKVPMRPPTFTADELLALAKPLDVNRIVLIQMYFYGHDNSYMLDSMRRFPGVFSGIALVDEHGADPAAEMKRLMNHGVRGVRIVPPKRGASDWLDGPGMRAMWKSAADNRLAMCPLVDPDDLPAIDRICRAFPETRVVIDHCARIGCDGSFKDAEVDELCSFASHFNVYVKLSAFYALGDKQWPYTDVLPLIKRLVDAFGPKRLMWASDNPFQVQPPHTYQASLELIRDKLDCLTASERDWVLKRTAASLFFD
jgi:predicted TIM-barrel fold metal-dependent hydrolase